MSGKRDQELLHNGNESDHFNSRKAIPFRSLDRPPRHNERAARLESPSCRIERKKSAVSIDTGERVGGTVEGPAEVHVGDDAAELATSDLCVCHSDPKIPRPRNAFILYRQHHASNVIAEYRGVSNPDVSKILGERWRNEPAQNKHEWKLLAEREKQHHQLQHPGYRYQPRRGGRRNNCIDSPTAASWIRCAKCGGRSMTSPTTPGSATSNRPSLLPLSASTVSSGPSSAQVSFMNSQFGTNRRSSTRHYPANITVPPPAHMGEHSYEDRGEQLSPTSKRRRFTNAGFAPVSYQPTVATPRYMNSPFRGSFAYPDSTQRWPTAQQGIVSQTRGPMQPPPTAHRDSTLTLPPLQTIGSSVEEVIMNMHFLKKIQILGRITPPLRPPKQSGPPFPVRGTVIAVEGDNSHAVSTVMRWLEDFLSTSSEYAVKTAKGPESPEAGRDIQLTDYFGLINEWHDKAQEITNYITTPVKHPTKSDNDGHAGEVSRGNRETLPVLLIQHYQLFASNVWACRTPKGEAYDPSEHWRWIASLWRGIVGPDLTVYVKDASAEEMNKSKQVEVVEDLRAIIVRKEKGPGPVQGEVDGRHLRRLGFEISEWVRLVSQLAKPQGEPGPSMTG